jgi:drug/metabolite transporter (DMT)-like permease
VAIWKGDRHALLALLGQSLLVALLLGVAFGGLSDALDPGGRAQKTENLLLLLAVSCFWFGCNSAAPELVRERVIFLRERHFSVRVDSYFSSKFLILAFIGMIQTTVLFAVVWVWCQPECPPAFAWFTLLTLAATGTAIGLLISAVAQTESVATALVPIVIIPQIILSGVITRLSGLGELMATWLITVYWGQRALESLLPASDLRILGRDQENWYFPFAVVLAHAVVGTVVTAGILWKHQGRTGSR